MKCFMMQIHKQSDKILQVRTQFGRPNWFNIFSKLARRHRGARIGKKTSTFTILSLNTSYVTIYKYRIFVHIRHIQVPK